MITSCLQFFGPLLCTEMQEQPEFEFCHVTFNSNTLLLFNRMWSDICDLKICWRTSLRVTPIRLCTQNASFQTIHNLSCLVQVRADHSIKYRLLELLGVLF